MAKNQKPLLPLDLTYVPAEPTRTITSTSDPIPLDWLLVPVDVKGRLGLTYAPGKQAWAISGGNNTGAYWQRSLPDDMARLRSHYGVDVIVSLLEDHEYVSLHIEAYTAEAMAAGMITLKFPIPDMGTPKQADAMRVVDTIVSMLRVGLNVAIHCRGGHGRAGTIGASVLLMLDMKLHPDSAMAAVRDQHDKRCVATNGQADFLYRFAGLELPVRPVTDYVRQYKEWNAKAAASSAKVFLGDEDIEDADTFDLPDARSWVAKPAAKPGPDYEKMSDAEFEAWVADYTAQSVYQEGEK